jgi:hypothetical protein
MPHLFNPTQAFLTYLHLISVMRVWLPLLSTSISWSQLRSLETKRLGWLHNKTYRKNHLLLNDEKQFSKLPNFKRTPNALITRRSETSLWPVFLQSWSVMRPKGNIHYTTNRDFRLFFLTTAPESGHNTLVSPRGYFSRWVDSYNFVFNLFFVDSFAQLMGSRLFVEESLVFNWQYSFKNYKLYKFVQPFLIFSDASYGEFVHDVISSLFRQNLDFLLILDLKSHDKLLKHLRRYHIFMIGLTPINYSPWVVSYPIPAFSDSYLTQYYFLTFVLRLYSHARSCSYLNALPNRLT